MTTHHDTNDHQQPTTALDPDGDLWTRTRDGSYTTAILNGQQMRNPSIAVTWPALRRAYGDDLLTEPTAAPEAAPRRPASYTTANPTTWQPGTFPTPSQLEDWIRSHQPGHPVVTTTLAVLLDDAAGGAHCRQAGHTEDLAHLDRIADQLAAAKARVTRLEETHPADPYACAECGTTAAQTYVVTTLNGENPETRTEVCLDCDDTLRARDPLAAAGDDE